MENNREQFQFKSNINCGGCVSAVKPHLDKAAGISHWEVNTDSPEKVLTVESTGISPEDVIDVVHKAGFKAERL